MEYHKLGLETFIRFLKKAESFGDYLVNKTSEALIKELYEELKDNINIFLKLVKIVENKESIADFFQNSPNGLEFFYLDNYLLSFKEKDSYDREKDFIVVERKIMQQIVSFIHMINVRLRYSLQIDEIEGGQSLNSIEYYKKEIDRLKKEKDVIQESSEEDKKKFMNLSSKIQKLETELKQKQKQEDAINDWNVRIENTFNILKTKLKPINQVYGKLEKDYNWFRCGIVTIVIMFFIAELFIVKKLFCYEGLPPWSEFLTVLVPLPVSAILLTLFIYQMNRAQRHMMKLANHIHEIEYIEGLLLAVNNLSTNIEDSTQRVNKSVGQLLTKYLQENKTSYEEDILLNEENKDKTYSLDQVIKLLKDIDGFRK